MGWRRARAQPRTFSSPQGAAGCQNETSSPQSKNPSRKKKSRSRATSTSTARGRDSPSVQLPNQTSFHFAKGM